MFIKHTLAIMSDQKGLYAECITIYGYLHDCIVITQSCECMYCGQLRS